MTPARRGTYRLSAAFRAAGLASVTQRGGAAGLPETLVLRDLIAALGCSEQQAYRSLDDGVLPGAQISPEARWRCARAAFITWLSVPAYWTSNAGETGQSS